MDEKRYIFETVEITDCDTDVSRITKVITDTKETYSYEDLEEIVDKLNEQQATIESLKEENDRIKTKGLDVLAFYESKLKNVLGTEDFQSVRDEIWIVRQVLYEMGVINDE